MDNATIIFFAILTSLIINLTFYLFFLSVAKQTETEIDDLVLRYIRFPLVPLFILAALLFIIPLLQFSSENARNDWREAFIVLFILNGAWVAIRIVYAVERALIGDPLSNDSYNNNISNNKNNNNNNTTASPPDHSPAPLSPSSLNTGRKLFTQVYLIRRLSIFTIIIVAIGAIVLTFPSGRSLGLSLLASAGLLTITTGMAAQPVLENLLASIQIAITQPLSIDDAVVIQGEWGRVEDIRATFIVLRTWDHRQLVIPLSTVISESFQNWTRSEDLELFATVYIRVDYSIPVAALRKELQRIVKSTTLWDRHVCRLVVSDASEVCITVRILVSARDPDDCWDLQHWVREKMLDYIRRHHGTTFPVVRTEMPRTRSKGYHGALGQMMARRPSDTLKSSSNSLSSVSSNSSFVM
eukprot:gb/GECH01000203.1/.p1 GENE.gb/GECH01000203.1/~~gb/GECH01000203.1/.p1  ORF type:complete len:412 (+),score=90.27 gb/GECH01000203.1/:1-1236(+)